MTNATDHLATLERLGAQQFRDTSLAADHSDVTRTVRRHRAVRAGVGTFAGMGLVGAGAYGLTQFDGFGAPIAPGVTSSPTPSEDEIEPSDLALRVAEGTSADAIAVHFSQTWLIPPDEGRDILETAHREAVSTSTAAHDLEGWLSPGTYHAADFSGPEEMAAAMVWPTVQALRDQGVEEERWLEVLTIASLVEQEVSNPEGLPGVVVGERRNYEDLPRVAAVIHNRLAMDMRLELDSTVQYATNSDGMFTSAEDRAVDSPYNTYIFPGLPPGPIGTVSPEAIAAAASPADGDWLYFVTVNLDSGEMLFAEDFEEHQDNVMQLQEWVRENDPDLGPSPSPSP